MAASTAEIKAHGILYQGIAEAYGYTGPPVFVCGCGHLDERHEGEDWEGACQDCDCQQWRQREAVE